MPENTTQIPAARVPIWDTVTLYVTREWYRFFYNLYEILGSGSLRYGTFYDTTDQTPTAINTPKAITYNTTDLSAGVSLGTPTSRIYVNRAGSYNFQFSLQLITTNATDKQVYIWARINGVDVANSASQITIGGATNHAYIAAWNFVLKMNTNDYFELMWAVDNTNMRIDAQVATAFCPAIPSVIMTVSCNIGA
jgi:hypothetical protein